MSEGPWLPAKSACFPPLRPVLQCFRLREGKLSAFLRASPIVSEQFTEFWWQERVDSTPEVLPPFVVSVLSPGSCGAAFWHFVTF